MIRKNLAILAKAAITLVIIWLVLSHVELAPVISRLRHIGPLDIVLGLIPFAAQMPLGAERWRLICRRLGVPLRFLPALQFVTIGNFFNQTLPSSVGGDAVRVWLLVRDDVPLGKAVNTVLSDRVLGLLVLLALSATTLPLFDARVGDPNIRLAFTAIVSAGVGGFAIFLLLGKRLGHYLKYWKITRPFGELAHDFHNLFSISATTAGLITSSVVVHLLTVTAAWLIATLLSVHASLLDCFIVIPPVVLLTMLPVSIGSWGVREGAMVVGFGLVGVASSDALAISICWGLANVAVGLPGGLLWLRDRQPAASHVTPAGE